MHPKYGADVENYTATPEMIAYCDNAMQTVQTILKEKFNVTDTLVYVRFDILVKYVHIFITIITDLVAYLFLFVENF